MISNAVANGPASSAPARTGNSGRATGEADTAFRDVLDKSGKAETAAADAETAGTETKSDYSGNNWRSAFDRLAEGRVSAKDAEAEAAGENGVAEGGETEEQLAAADPSVTVPAPETKQAADTTGAARADVVAANASPAAAKAGGVKSEQQATGLDRAAEVASENARLGDKAAVGQTAAGKANESEAAAGGKAPTHVAAEAAKTVMPDPETARRGSRNADAPRPGAVADRQASTTASPNGAAAGKAGTQVQSVEQPGAADTRAAASGRVTGEPQGEPRRGPVEAIGPSARPSPETSAVKSFVVHETAQPGTETSPGRQVADAVARELEELGASRLHLSANTSQSGKTIRTMRLQLNPAELGAVNIRLQSVDGELQVTIRAENEQAAQKLNSDSDAIRSALRAAGMTGADVVVTSNRGDTGQSQNFNAQHRDPSGQQMANQESGRNASGESRQSYRDTSSNDSANIQTRTGDAGDNGTGGDRIYI